MDEAWGPTVDARQPGLSVRNRQRPSETGVTTGNVRSSAGRNVAQVRLTSGELTYIPISLLELLPQNEGRYEAFSSCRTGGPSDLSRQLLAEKISGRLTDTYYSMESGDAEFFPHQFRPVLQFIESNVGRILIADEVGLGKTISAIYIWKELQARSGARRLVIICPAVLREKWREELRHRFSIESEIVDAKRLYDCLSQAQRDPLTSFALIGGLEGLRSRRRTDGKPARKLRQRLMQLLQENPRGSDGALVDLVVIDEAHAARNPQTANFHTVDALREVSAHMVLLTATPIQTHSENLYSLLRLIDPDRFVSADTFEQVRQANIPLIAAMNSLLQLPPDESAFKRNLRLALEEPLFRDDKSLHDLADRMPTGASPAQRLRIARSLEARSLLSDVMVRTRKREAFKNRVVRKPIVLDVSLSSAEARLYEELSKRIRARARRSNTCAPEAFILIGRQRQLASSIPAALDSWRSTGHLDELLWEDLGVVTDNDEEDDLADIDDIPIDDLLQGHDFEKNDTKYREFLRWIRTVNDRSERNKIVVFSFFRRTLAYLKRRLAADGINSAMILGGMGKVTHDGEEIDAKNAEIERFRTQDDLSVLLSSEVGSEGIDLQFAHHIFNYDLPWNPMRVEQRIGRVDRIGQTADHILVGHFRVTGTVDDKILNRLYDRINVFRETIGDIDEIFGESIQSIILEYFQDRLSAEECERRLEQNVLAEESRKIEIDRLDREAPILAGHADFILKSIRADRDAGRFVRPDDLRIFVTEFLHERYPGSSVEYDSDDRQFLRVSLSSAARDALATFLQENRPFGRTRLSDPGRDVLVTFNPRMVKQSRRRQFETITLTHPLIVWIRNEWSQDDATIVPAVSVEVERGDLDILPGPYLFVTDRWTFKGVRSQVTLQNRVLSAHTRTCLENIKADKLIDIAVNRGSPLDLSRFHDEHGSLSTVLADCEKIMIKEYDDEFDAFILDNDTRVSQARQLIEARAARKLADLERRLEQQRASSDAGQRRVASATEGLIKQAKAERDQQLARIDRQGNPSSSQRPIVGGLIFVT